MACTGMGAVLLRRRDAVVVEERTIPEGARGKRKDGLAHAWA
jgi:hypothetical protein